MKRIISIIILISLLLMSVPAHAISGTGTESNPYLISSASDIAKIHNDLDGYYKLTSNINMSGVEFEPIGNENEGAFTGTIDGNGYTISNLNINLPENKYVGFVGYLEGTIKNLNLTNVDAYGYRYVGGLVGYAETDSSIYNCSVSGKLDGEYQVIDLNIGGIVGYNNGTISKCYNDNLNIYESSSEGLTIGGIASKNYGMIEFCTNSSTIYASDAYQNSICVGGITSYNYGTIDNCINKSALLFDADEYVLTGGISFKSDKGTITNCINYGNISAYRNAAGICGEFSGTISNCINYGDISAEYSSCYAGGIFSETTGFNSSYKINNCINYGDIRADGGSTWQSYAGGISGSGGNITSCINYGTIYSLSSNNADHRPAGGISGDSAVIQNCINNGFIKQGEWKGGISGTNLSQNISNCINYGVVDNGSGYEASIFCTDSSSSQETNKNNYQLLEVSNNAFYDGYRSSRKFEAFQLSNLIEFEELKGNNSLTGFDFTNIWFVDSSKNSGLPQLRNMPRHIELNECVEIMEVGDTDKLYAYIDGTSETVTWSSDNTAIATVSSNGTITANSIGTCTITATNSNGSKAKCLVYVYGEATSMQLSESEINLNRGNTISLSTVQEPNYANENATWYSENENIATVDQCGNVTAIAKGQTTIYAISSHTQLRADCIVNVASPITNLYFSPSSKTIKLGDSETLNINISPSEYEGSITWSSADEEIATVDQNGKVTANKLGTTTIIVTASSGVTAECAVTVNQPATSIRLNKTGITTYAGSTYQLSATILPADTTDTITWSSSSTSYATVSSTGLVTGVKARSSTITITATTSSGLSATCYVTVQATQVMPTSVALSDTYITLAPDDAKALTPTFEPSNTTETTLVWTSSDESVATVDKNGVVTAVSNGFATIRGKTINGLTSECVVKVISATGTSVLLDNTKASPGGTAQVKANIIKNSGLSAYKFKVNYDASVLTPVSITPNSEFGGTFSTNLEDTDRTELNVLWYSGNDDVVANGELFTVNFKVNDSAAYGDSSIVSIEYGATDVCDVSGNYIAIYTENATVSITDPRPGDIYEDSDVNVYDLTLLARYITSLETFTERQEEAADVNNDGRVDILDVIRLAQYLVNWSGIELMSLDLYDEPTTPVVSVGSASVNESNEAEIPVYIKNNSGVLGYRFVLDYNAEDIEILSITPSELINKDGFNHNLGAESQATDGLVVSCFASGNNITDDGVLFTIKVRYKNPADTSVSPISVVDSFDNMGNENATYVTATYETGYALGSDYIVANKVVSDTNFSCELYFGDSYAEQFAKAIIAFYDGDGRMVQLMPKDITVKPGKVDLSIDYDKKAYATYKLMIWEGLNSLKPITKVK